MLMRETKRVSIGKHEHNLILTYEPNLPRLGLRPPSLPRHTPILLTPPPSHRNPTLTRLLYPSLHRSVIYKKTFDSSSI